MKLFPDTPEEWQTVVDAARGAIVFDAARQYGLVKGGPEVNVERCQRLLELGQLRGYTPACNAVERFVAALLQAHSAP
jgi:hypothetical protein